MLYFTVASYMATSMLTEGGSIPSAQYEIGMGSVEVNHGDIDGRVVVIFNKKWKDNYCQTTYLQHSAKR